ncbi:MAG: hypothetical protein RIR21_1183 [Pseudomonadota bacterium]
MIFISSLGCRIWLTASLLLHCLRRSIDAATRSQNGGLNRNKISPVDYDYEKPYFEGLEGLTPITKAWGRASHAPREASSPDDRCHR